MTELKKAQPEADLYAIVDVLRASGLNMHEIIDIVASLILLRWLDQADAEAAAEAAFEERPHQPLFPPRWQWRIWSRTEPVEMAQRLSAVAKRVSTTVVDSGPGAHLSLLSEPLHRLLKLEPNSLADAVRWAAAFPMDTPSERWAVLEAFDLLLKNASSPNGPESATPPSVATLMVSVADPRPGESVFDPCFGHGGLLVSALRHAETSKLDRSNRLGPKLDITGIEMNPRAFLLGLLRLLLAGSTSARLAIGNSLESAPLRNTTKDSFDVVLANPPMGAKTQRDKGCYFQFPYVTPDLTGMFVQQALAQLKPQGRAVIAVTDGFLFRSGVECELRRSLIEQNQVEAVIGLPTGAFLPYTSVKCSLLVLRKRGKMDRIRMVDAAPFFEPAKGKRPAMLRAAMADQLAHMVRGLLAPDSGSAGTLRENLTTSGTGLLSQSVWEVSTRDLEAAEWDLQARRREKGELEERLSSLKEAIGNEGDLLPLSSVAEVIGGISIKAADLIEAPLGGEAPPYLRIRDLARGIVQSPSNWVQPVVAQALSPRLHLLPADVLLSKSGTIGKTALVRNGAVGAIASSGLYVIRVKDQRVDPGFLLGYLASAACQEWLDAQRRGTSIQHLNMETLARLLVPVPSLTLQLQAAKQFHEAGTDVLEFLVRSLKTGSQDHLTPLMAKLAHSIPPLTSRLDSPIPLKKLRSIVAGVQEARNACAQDIEGFRFGVLPWLNLLSEAIRPLEDAAFMPRGPSLFSVIKAVERGLETSLLSLTGRMPVEIQARALSEGLREWMRALIGDLVGDIRLKVESGVSQLAAGSSAEITLQIVNESALPFSSFRIASHPDWGYAEAAFFQERSSMPLTLRGDPPKRAGTFSLQLKWTGNTLGGDEANGEIQLSFDIVEDAQKDMLTPVDLGGSPYITGDPLFPDEDSDVFFGRETLLQQISRQVVLQGNVVLLEGNRRAGKTSILRHLEGTKAVPGWLAVYASLQGAEGDQTKKGVPTEAIFREIANKIALALITLGAETPLPDGTIVPAGGYARIGKACKNGISVETPYTDFREYLTTILSILAKRNLGLLLMLDEFDVLQEGIDHGVTSPQVPENIRNLIQDHRRFSAILTGSRRLKRLREEYWSALFGLGTSFQVTALDSESARRVVVEPVRGKLTYSPEAVDRVLTLSARQPFLLQCLCNSVFDFAAETKSRVVTVDSVDEAASVLVKSGGLFSKLWDYAAQGILTGRRRSQFILLLLAAAFKRSVDIEFGTLQETLLQHGVEISDEAIAADLEYLRELELVSLVADSGSSRYRLAIPLMADWIDQEQDPEVVRRRAISEAEDEGDIRTISNIR